MDTLAIIVKYFFMAFETFLIIMLTVSFIQSSTRGLIFYSALLIFMGINHLKCQPSNRNG